MDLVKLSALKDEKFVGMVVGAVTIIAIAPFGWLQIIDPTTIFATILSISGLVIGKDITGRVAEAAKKVGENQKVSKLE